MHNKKIALLLVLILLFSNFNLLVNASEDITSVTEYQNTNDNTQYQNTYNSYLMTYGEVKSSGITICKGAESAKIVKGASFGDYADKSNVLILSEPDSSFVLPVDIETEGYYQIYLTYTGIVESDKNIKLSLNIDGEQPFVEADSFELQRCYINETDDFELDSQGNDLRPVQIQIKKWQKIPLFKKNVGTIQPYEFYFSAGKHEIQIKADNGGVAFSSFELSQPEDIISYQEYEKKNSNFERNDTLPIRLQGEKANLKSDISLYPLTDRTNCATKPFDEFVTKLNTIGGSNWSNPGQRISWDFKVEKAGFYQISLRVRQNTNKGMKCYRTIRINDEIPFKELSAYGFKYNRSWYIETLCNENTGEPFEFYFLPGNYSISMECTTGDMCEPLEKVNETITELNDIYHNIIMITGTSPDTYRDYNLEKSIPGLIQKMNKIADDLYSQMESIKKVTKGSGTQAVSLITMADQLKLLAKRPKTISDRVSNFYSNISAVSAWANSAFNQPLEIDCIQIADSKSPQIKKSENFFKNIISALKSFVASYLIDYNSVGVANGKEDVVAWTTAGREQAEVLKRLIDRDFTPEKNVNVSLKLVNTGLVEAVVAGIGPDVALAVGMSQPIDFASRGVLEPLDSYDGFNEFVEKNFYENSLIPFEFRGNTYAIPMTQEFNMMFYRKDILSQLQLGVPNTWDELNNMLPILARNNMQIGIPSISSVSSGSVNTAFPQTIVTLFMQNKVELYNKELTKTNLRDKDAVLAFQQLTDLYTKYGLPTYFDAANRFRTGEMPIIISSIATYNSLAISAPEIAGCWDMARIPGTIDENGEINRTDEFSSSASIIFKTAKNKTACWEFLKWYSGEETQFNYGMELEAILGESGRYMTANKLAFERLPWDSETADVIRSQWQEVSTVPQVPGYYFVSRYLTNAISDVIVNNENPKVVIGRYADVIDAELKRKNEQIDKLWKN